MYNNKITLTCQEAYALSEVLNSKYSRHEETAELVNWLRNFADNEHSPIIDFRKLPNRLKALWKWDLSDSHYDHKLQEIIFHGTDDHFIAQQWYKKFRPARLLDSKLGVRLSKTGQAKYQLKLREIFEEVCGPCEYNNDYYDIWYPSLEDCTKLSSILTDLIVIEHQAPQYVYMVRKQIMLIGNYYMKLKDKE